MSCRVAVCWDGEWSRTSAKLGCYGYTSAHCPPSSSHPVAICSDAGQRNHRRIGVDQTTPQREGEQGGARQGVACHSTSSTGQYRMAWATFSTPSCSYPPCWRQSSPQLKSSSDRICRQNDTFKETRISLHCTASILSEKQSFVACAVYLILFTFTTGIGVEVRYGQVRFICGCLTHTHQKWILHAVFLFSFLFFCNFTTNVNVCSKVVATDYCFSNKGLLLWFVEGHRAPQMLLSALWKEKVIK